MVRGTSAPMVDGKKVCTSCGVPKVLDEFTKAKHGLGGRQAVCKECVRQKYHNSKPNPETSQLLEERPSCSHVRVCGDDLVARRLPDFFATHAKSESGWEWQVCTKCGDAKQVQLNYGNEFSAPVMSSLKEFIAEVPKQKEKEEMPASTNGHSATVDLDDGPVVTEENFEVKYNDALEVIKHQQLVIDDVTVRLMDTLKLLAAANRRARLAEIETAMFKLEAERAQLLDQAA